MSLVKVQGNASGTGTLTIAAPNTNSNFTLDIPTASGTLQVSGNPISGTTGTFSGTISGGSTVGVGGATPSASGAGITFPATQSASTNANTLDDYEEGTWTPTITFGGGSTGLTFASRTGRYVKIGKMVYAGFTFSLSNKGSSTGGSVIGGLPFSSGSTDGAQRYSGACGYYDNFTGIGMVQLLIESGSSSSALRYATATSSTAITDANFTNSSGMHGIFIYETD